MGFREPQTPGLGGLDELTSGEEAVVQAIDAGTFFRDNIEPTGAVNGINVTFTLPNAPNPTSSLLLVINGFVQIGAGKDYTLSSVTITMGEAPATGSIIRAWYRTEP